MTVQKVIQDTGLPRAMIARLAGVNEATVWAWLRPTGADAARAPSAESVDKLARGLASFGARLQELAEGLETDDGR